MGKIYCIMGKSASGKDTVYRMLLEDRELSLKRMVPYTTRPVRAGEKDGENYFFTDEEGFKSLSEQGKVIESRTYDTVFGPWRYFTADDGRTDPGSFDYILITTPEGYKKIRDYYGKETVIPLYIDLENGERLKRAIFREQQQTKPDYREVCRRFLADEEDFSGDKLEALGIEESFDNTNSTMCAEAIKSRILKS